MDALQKNIAVTRGEAIAAHLLATAALQAMFMMIAPQDRRQALDGMTAFLTDSLNAARPAKGDPDDEFATQMRETARHHVEQCLDHIEAMIRNSPKG